MQSDNSLFSFHKEAESRNALLAVPKKGRLFEKCASLLAGAGLQYDRPNRLDVAHCTNLPLTIVFLPAADIATYVGDGNVDMGITGVDVVQESDVDVDQILELGFGKCKLCLQAPIASEFKSGADLSGKRIVTSYPKLARNFFDKYDTSDRKTNIKYVSGSVEAACALGLADAVVDLVETGTTMMAAGLHVVEDLITTQAVLITSKNPKHPEMVSIIKKRIQGYQTAISYMMISYNISREFLNKALEITPGKRAATVSPLEGGDAVAVSALVKQKESSAIMDALENTGATDILLFAINNSRM